MARAYWGLEGKGSNSKMISEIVKGPWFSKSKGGNGNHYIYMYLHEGKASTVCRCAYGSCPGTCMYSICLTNRPFVGEGPLLGFTICWLRSCSQEIEIMRLALL